MSDEAILDPIVVSADFRDQNLSQTNNAITVIGEDELYDKASQPFIETLASTPNVNFSSGASKAKYIQIRGVGIRSQYETPITPSVGLIVDGIDLSNATMAASLFDTKQVEILRGPQGSTFGANALGGIITAQSNEPTKETQGHIETTVGNYNTKAIGAAVGGELSENLLGRLSIYKNTSDGYMKNWTPTTGLRKDKNNIDELYLKTHLRWKASEDHTIDLNLLHADVDNGYDGFSLENTRTTHSDQPGTDAQKTNALSLQSTYDATKFRLLTKISHSKSDLLYSYDDDWSYVDEFHDDPSTHDDDPYSSFDQYSRDQKITDLDIRALSNDKSRLFNNTTDWTVGLYAKKFNEDLVRYHPGGSEENFDNSYQTTNKAVYGQLDTPLNNKLILTTGLRVEKWDAKYSDSHNVSINNSETMTGGKIGLNYEYASNQRYYATLSKGYKPGGVNADSDLSAEDKTFTTETLWNLETGVNSSHLNNTLKSRLNVFYGKRKDMQVKLYQVDGQDFTDYLSNASKASYYGLESQLSYRLNDVLHLYSSIGLLKATFDQYADKDGRDVAQSPRYQYNAGLDYFFGGNWKFNTNIEGKGSYYFSDTHDQKADSYTLWNGSLEYVKGEWSATLWARNITNENYYVRGFYWGNNPSTYYADTLYTQLGAPRTFGVTLSYDF
jgi:outer membrane receptor protein involved in Fe transport